MQEITAIKAAVKPSETLFVVDAMTGQDAVNTAKEFNDRLDFDGVVLTKLDGDTRGGAAISIRSVVSLSLIHIFPAKNPRPENNNRREKTDSSIQRAKCADSPHTYRIQHTGQKQDEGGFRRIIQQT